MSLPQFFLRVKDIAPARPAAPVVPIRAESLSLLEIEAALLQVIAQGKKASVAEESLVAALGSTLPDPSVTEWANKFTSRYEFSWVRRRLFEDLLFALADDTDGFDGGFDDRDALDRD